MLNKNKRGGKAKERLCYVQSPLIYSRISIAAAMIVEDFFLKMIKAKLRKDVLLICLIQNDLLSTSFCPLIQKNINTDNLIWSGY